MYQSNAELDVRYNSVHVCTYLCMYQVNYSEEMQQVCVQVVVECVAVEVRKRTFYRKLILRKWCLKFSNDFDVIVDVVLDCLVYACKTFTGHSARLCFTCIRRCIE